ncbi:hypothetical protein K1T71_008306 [Dendrolimus kikuchii]|uniref:Uncharacterized protein n=1 Tax=Dendrolimus kikuchii TaxID=765133 RepID=A0ACC1CWZ6_9NEOP|nr:hypothetical protein K1T71_008306 [Dendrolimus kikuchii]
MEVANRACNLECIKKGPPVEPVMEFVGPVKIVLVQPDERAYRRKTIGSGCIGLAYLMIGATVMTVLFYTSTFKEKISINSHIFLCAVGYQLCMPLAILLISDLNGPSASMKLKDRKCQHLILQIFGLMCSAGGSVIIILYKLAFTLHSIAGLAAGGFAFFGVITGIVAYAKKSKSSVPKIIHTIFGTSSFVAASLCFGTGVLKIKPKSGFVTSDFIYFLIFFCGFYTLIVVYGPIYKWIKFVGPIKVLVIESKAEYCRTVWCFIGLGISQVLMGATIMVILLYSIATYDGHPVLYGLAYHFFSAEAILSLNYANGWTSPMRLRHRRFVHAFLQVCALSCAITGTIILVVNGKGLSKSAHSATGLITVALSVISLMTGPFALLKRRCTKIVHMSFGIPTFLMSSVSICCSFVTPAFKNWTSPLVIYILTGFVVFYTTFIVVASFMKCMMRI